MRPLLLAALCVILTACSSGSGGNTEIVRATLGKIVPWGSNDEAEAEAEAATPTPRLTRAAVEAAGTPILRVRLEAEDGRSVMAAQAANGGYVNYVSRFGQSVTAQGALITASRGLGFDLLSVEADAADDPLVTPRPIEDWPARVMRIYRFPGNGPDGEVLRVTCRYAPGDTLELEIVEVTHQGQQIVETCVGDGIRFDNDLFADVETGFVWRSLQWVGPQQGRLDIEVVAPIGGA
ncbi:MAG: YjbF family lipoprotein [Pseudomonadota bacterium]